MNALETIGEYGSRIDARADAFLTRSSSDLYGMLRYFMGYTDEHLTPVTHSVGKRLRPGLLLYLVEQYGATDSALPAALSIELFHNFTLIHDDIEDNDEVRRGRPTVWKLWGINKAINAGDVQLIATLQALREGNTLKEDRYIKLEKCLLSQYIQVAEGQHLDFVLAESPLGGSEVTIERYLEMITKKSAELIAASTKVAGIISGCSSEEQNALYSFGRHLGIAYQLHDDYQSMWGEREATGKESGGDIREHKKTYPLLFAHNTLPKESERELERQYSKPEVSVEAVLTLLEEAGARDATKKLIQQHVRESKKFLSMTNLSHDAKVLLEELIVTLVS